MTILNSQGGWQIIVVPGKLKHEYNIMLTGKNQRVAKQWILRIIRPPANRGKFPVRF